MLPNQSSSVIAMWISLISNFILSVVKILLGFLFNSQVLLADGVHNVGDIIATMVTLSSSKISQRPPDDDHPYGHGKAEVLGAGFVAIILVLASIFIAYHSIDSLFKPPHKASLIILLAAFMSLIWKQALYMYTLKVAKENNSKALIATAYDHLADVYASLASVIGVGVALMGDFYGIAKLAYADPIAGIVVSILILKLVHHMSIEVIDILMEKNVSPEKMQEYILLVAEVDRVKRIDKIRAREHGHYILVDVRVSVLGTLTVQEGHNVSRDVKRKIMMHHKDVIEVLIHINPWYEDYK